MKLFYSPNSPYARIARVAAIESGVASAIEHVQVRNRASESPLLDCSPVGRVPTLVSGELVLCEARNICSYFGALTGSVQFFPRRNDWVSLSLESMIVGFLDGVAVWIRERRRNTHEQSGFLLQVEEQRAKRCLAYFERQVAASPPGLNHWSFAEIALACALEIMEFNSLVEGWPDDCPALKSWLHDRSTRTSMLETRPL
jgi:glutathione S-transferase